MSLFNSRILDGLKMPGDDEIDLVTELTESLFQTTPPRFAKMKNLIQEGNLYEASREAHSLKSAFRTMGGEFLGDLCQKMETDFKEEMAPDQALELCERAVEDYLKFAQQLASFTGVQFPPNTGKAT